MPDTGAIPEEREQKSICLCTIGILLTVLHFLGYRTPIIALLITIPAVIFMVIFAQRYDHNK